MPEPAYDLSMTSPSFGALDIEAETRFDGSLILRNRLLPIDVGGTLPDRLRHWARVTPDHRFLSEGLADGLRSVTYGQAQATVRRWAARLLALDISPASPIAIIAGNSINHALLMLAATSVGFPVAVVTPAYASKAAAPFVKLRRVLEAVTPGLIVADDLDEVRQSLQAIGLPVRTESMADLGWLEAEPPVGEDVLMAAEAGIGPATLAKLLFTSGSTGSPKPVINTQRMMVSNMEGIAAVWPFLTSRPPVMVDWLPWSHTFGGNCCFNLALFFGGALHIDSGKPVPALVGRTVEALRAFQPSVYFNVPAGYEALLPALEGDREFATKFFSGLEFLFNAAAALPAPIRARLEAAAHAAIGRSPLVIGAWGSTETAPFATVIYFQNPHANNLGAPLPGVEIKLHPNEGRTELRVKGPNVMPGYWRQPEATAAVFDEEGFYCIGDAGILIDSARPEIGIAFDGRVAENFKLVSGTWVNVGGLRLAAIAAAQPLISDVVITGEGRDTVGALVFPNEAACRAFLEGQGVAPGDSHPALHPLVIGRLRDGFQAHNAAHHGSSARIGVFDVLTNPPQAHADEITEKGYVNQRRVLSNRRENVEALYASGQAV